MKVELEEDETWQLMSLVVARLVDDAGLSSGDRAKVRRWRSESMKAGREPMRVLTRKINDDLAQVWERKKRSGIRKPDWR
ncbi:MAG: hypothetical protein IIB19_06230 [Chloroflexi bacterium]|nr:hypothetical protein [Chloroflexota bacterium]